MKPILQVPLAVIVVSVLVYIMYSQSQKSAEKEESAYAPVENTEIAGEETVQEAIPEEVVVEEQKTVSEGKVADDAIADDAPVEEDPTPQKQASRQKQADKDRAKRASASLRQRRRNMFKKIDADNKDGIASKEEHDEFFRKAFNFYDKNDDGRLSGKERSQVKRLPRKADANKDGILTRKEFLDQFERFFVIMDKDESGDLTEKEFVR